MMEIHIKTKENVIIFLKIEYIFQECFCCRESYLKERVVLLDHCYDADGVRLEGEILGTMEIKLREPAECKCTKCGGFSR